MMFDLGQGQCCQNQCQNVSQEQGLIQTVVSNKRSAGKKGCQIDLEPIDKEV